MAPCAYGTARAPARPPFDPWTYTYDHPVPVSSSADDLNQQLDVFEMGADGAFTMQNSILLTAKPQSVVQGPEGTPAFGFLAVALDNGNRGTGKLSCHPYQQRLLSMTSL